MKSVHFQPLPSAIPSCDTDALACEPSQVTSKVATTRRDSCSACGHSELEEVIDLPKLPLTGVFVLPEERSKYPDFNQALMRCTECGHGQLRETVDPRYLYQDTYTHRSSLSPISTRGNDFFLAFLEDVTVSRHFHCIAEVGCNDLYLLKKLAHRGGQLIGFDPIWKGRSVESTDKIRVSGNYIEEIDPSEDLPSRPDLVLSVHTLEHVNNPLNSLRPIFEYALPGAVFVIEVPSLDSLLHVGRFDQIFHQHLNYFSLASICRMIRQLGGQFISHRYNYDYWLGTMLVAFTKSQGTGSGMAQGSNKPPLATSDEIRRQYASYREAMGHVTSTLERLIRRGTPAIGFGAAQMLPVLAYHLQSNLNYLLGILDDNLDKAGRTYPSIAAVISPAAEYPSLKEYAVLITALDSARAILNRVTGLRARYIVVPSNPF